MGKKIKIGDLAEISTARGKAYALFTHKETQWGALLRVYSGVHPDRPDDLSSLLSSPVQFVVFFPLQAAVNRGLVDIVGNFEVPKELEKAPRFRSAGAVDRDGRVLDWYVEGAFGKQRVTKLTDKQKKLPIRQVVNDTALIEMIEGGWAADQRT